MNAKIVAIVAVCVAVIAAGISGVVISMQRADAARAAADKAASEETTAAANERKAKAEAQAEANNRKAQEAEQKTAEANERKAAAEAQAEANIRKAKEAELKTAKENADAERAKAQAAADELVRAEATKAIREAETLKLKVSMAELEAAKQQYAELNAELLEYQKELDERERALRPEKTIADLSWLPDEDTEIDENGHPRPKKKKPYLAENDPNLSVETRELAKASRIRAQADDILAKDSRKRVVAPIEKLYVAAVKDGRTVDAAYYRAALKSMYPDWEYKAPPEEAKEEKK